MRRIGLALLVLVWSAPAWAQQGGDTPEDEGTLDVGMPPADEDQPPDDQSADDHPPDETAPDPDEGPVRDPVMAKKLADGAAKFVKKGDKLAKRKKTVEASAEYEHALAVYDKSFEMNPVASVMLASAQIAAKLEHWVDAAQRFRRALADIEIRLDTKAQAKAQAGLDEVMANLGAVTLTIIPDGASLTLDGADLGTTPLAEPVILDPGEHHLVLKAEGYLDFETKFAVDAGSESDRTFELKPVPVVVEKPRPPPPPPPPPPLPPPPSKLPWLAGAGATGLFTVGAVVFGAVAVGKHSTFADPSTSPADRDAAASSGRTMAALSDVCTTLAVVSAGFTVYYYLKIYTPKAKARRDAEVSPSAGPGFAGLVLSGRF